MKSYYPKYRKYHEELEDNLTASDHRIVQAFVDYCATTAQQSRVAKCRRYLMHFRDIVEKPLDSVTKEDAIKFWGLVNQSEYQEHTKIDIRKIVRRFLKWQYRDLDMLEALKVPSSHLVNKRRVNKATLLTTDELQLMLHRAERLRDKTLLLLLYETAARPQEVRDLRWRDVNWRGQEVHLYSRKTQEDRDLPIDRSLEQLRRWKEEWVFTDPQESDFIFPSTVGSRHDRTRSISVAYINKLIKRLARKAGIERNVFTYLLRHTRLTELRRRGVQGIELNKFAGHKPGSKQEYVYLHLDNNDMKTAVIDKVYRARKIKADERSNFEQRIAQLEIQLGQVLELLQESKDVMASAVIQTPVVGKPVE